MRISDWSSDVCSSDLRTLPSPPCAGAGRVSDAAFEMKNVSRSFGVRLRLGDLIAARFARKALPQVYAVNDVSLRTETGEGLGIVGESGCGKATLARLRWGLYKHNSERVGGGSR